jgi:hypothetical protein
MKTYLRLWCEWDYGQETVIFTEERVAKNWLYARIIEVDGEDFFIEQEWENDPDAIFDEGFAEVGNVTLIEESS